MKLVIQSNDFNLTSVQELGDKLWSIIPKLLAFLAFILIAWLFIKITLYIIKKALNKTNIDKWDKKLQETKIFGNSTINIVLTKVILGVLKWVLVLIFILVGADLFGLDIVSEGISNLIGYLPKLITALLILVGGIYLGTMVKKAIQSMFKSVEISGGNLVGNIAFYLIVVFIGVTALEQAGVDTSVIKSNITLILGSVLLAFTIAFGLGSKDVIQRLLFGFYSRKNLEPGQKIKIGKKIGTIVAIDNIALTLQTESGLVILPIKEVVDKKVEILK